MQGGKGFKSFYFTNYPLLYDDSEPDDERVVNAKEWGAYLGHGVTVADVQKEMYPGNCLPNAVSQSAAARHHKPSPGRSDRNTFLNALKLPENKAAAKYYGFAKNIEAIADIGADRWDTVKTDVKALDKGAKDALKNGLVEKDAFLKLRYFYQAQRLLHYGGNFEEAAAIYNKYIVRFRSRSHVKGWALALYAGEERRLGHTVKAAYFFSQVFARYPERRAQAYKNYFYISARSKAVFKLAANNKERAYIAAIEGFHTPTVSIKPLQSVYRYNPASPMVGVLLIREINKLEDVYLTPKLGNKLPDKPYRLFFDNPDSKSRMLYRQHITRLKEFCKTLSAEGRYPEPGLGYLTIAYLCWMENKVQEGKNALNEAEEIKLSPRLDDQRHILNLMLAAQSLKTINETNQDSLLTELQWLDKKIVNERAKAKAPDNEWAGEFIPPFAASARDFYQFVLTPIYLKQGDTAMAALTILKSEINEPGNNYYLSSPWRMQMLDFWSYYLSSSQLKKVIALKQHRPHAPYMRLLTDGLAQISNSDLSDLLGTAYLREHKYQAAVNALQKVRPHKNETDGNVYAIDEGGLADPFVNNLNDYPKIYHQDGSAGYNKLGFARAMLRLEKQTKSRPKNAAANYYKMAVGLYNTSFSGNAWYLISYSWSCYDPARRQSYIYDGDYLRSVTAEKYFIKARELNNNLEFKAKCTFMAAKCRQKQVRVPGEEWIEYDARYERAIRLNPYFKTLRDGYSKTAFYKLAVNECSYLRDFLASATTQKKIKSYIK